jgi:hypothetical protein
LSYGCSVEKKPIAATESPVKLFPGLQAAAAALTAKQTCLCPATIYPRSQMKVCVTKIGYRGAFLFLFTIFTVGFFLYLRVTESRLPEDGAMPWWGVYLMDAGFSAMGGGVLAAFLLLPVAIYNGMDNSHKLHIELEADEPTADDGRDA